MTRYTIEGRDSWQARSGYRYHTDPNAPLLKSEPIVTVWWVLSRTALLFGCGVVAVLALVAFS